MVELNSAGRVFRRLRRRAVVLTACLALLGATAVATAATAASASPAVRSASSAAVTAGDTTSVPPLDHVFLIMEENNGFQDVIGNPAAPNLNYLASTFGLETDYYGVSPCCSESNYVQLLGGTQYPNVQSDDAYWKNSAGNAPNLISQLDQAGVSWKAYLQALPYAGYQGICYPAKCNGAPDSDPLYVSKHDGIQNFANNQNPADWGRQVPVGQLTSDLRSGAVPRFGYIVPDECHDMHGDPPYCLDSGNVGDPQNQHLVSVGDAYLGQLVREITNASFWGQGNNRHHLRRGR
jgi:phospholipase C